MFRHQTDDSKESHRSEGDVEPALEKLSRQLREKSPNGHRIEMFEDAALMENLHLANALYDKNFPGEPNSTRPILARVFTFFKRLVLRLTAWYVVPAIESQRLFNAYMTRTVNEMKHYLDHLQINEDILSTIMHRDLSFFRANILYLNKYLERRMLDFEQELALARRRDTLEIPEDAGGGNGASYDPDLISSLDVLTLEQRVHGSPRMVRDRQRIFLQYFKDCHNVLAIGCGRGELLQLFNQEGIPARGTETNPALADYCRDNELDVTTMEGTAYLETCPDQSLDGMVLARFAGHRPPACLIKMLNLCYCKLKEGSPLVIESPNPFSLYTVASYVLDGSERIHPLHPETLKLLCVTYGFRDPTVMFLNPLPPEDNLQELELSGAVNILDPAQHQLFDAVNRNFRKLNSLIFSHGDYAVVCHRGLRG